MTAGPFYRHWPLAIVLALAAVALFTNLDRDYLWSDEGDTAVLARSILANGVPTAWDGVTFTDSDYGARVSNDLVTVGAPWLQYYVVAGSFALLGESTFAARAPFALAGLITIALVYVIVYRTTGSRWTALSAAVLLMLSVQFLVYARQSRHYSLSAALTCLLVLQFFRLTTWKASLLFGITGALLFHSHPIALASVAALGLLTVIAPAFAHVRKGFWRAMPIVAAGTLPFLFLARGGYSVGSDLTTDPSRFLSRLAQVAVEFASVTSILGVLILAFVIRRRRFVTQPRSRQDSRPRRRRVPVLTVDERLLVVTLALVMAAGAVLLALTQPRNFIWEIGVRYTPAVLPFMAMVLAMCIARASRGRLRPWIALILIFGFTKLGRLTPWTFWQEPTVLRDPSAVVTFHEPERLVDRVFRTGQIAFARSLVASNPGTTARIVEFLRAHAQSSDIVVTNYGWEPLYFHTGLPLGMTVLPSYPIYEAARAEALPEYVFGAEGARWIVWRQAWGAYRGQRLDRLVADLQSANVPVELVATIPETLWENRENIHFRRFAGNRYIYPWHPRIPDALIFRVGLPRLPGSAEGN